jgi:hypothetical protein
VFGAPPEVVMRLPPVRYIPPPPVAIASSVPPPAAPKAMVLPLKV